MEILRIPLSHLSDINKLKVISKAIRLLIEQGKRDRKIRMMAVRIVKNCKPKDYLCEVKTLHKWVQDDRNIRYVKDTFGVERFATVKRTLEEAAGDCDDKSIVLQALAEAIGHETRTVLVDGDMQGKFTHVIPQIKIDDKWYYTEVTRPEKFGWKPPMTKAYVIPQGGEGQLVNHVLAELESIGGLT